MRFAAVDARGAQKYIVDLRNYVVPPEASINSEPLPVQLHFLNRHMTVLLKAILEQKYVHRRPKLADTHAHTHARDA